MSISDGSHAIMMALPLAVALGAAALMWRQSRAFPTALKSYRQKLFLAGAAFFAVLFEGLFVIDAACKTLGIASPWREALALSWIIGPLAAARWLRLPGAFRRSHALVIHAAPQIVWETVRYRQTMDYYRATVARIVWKHDGPETYELHLRDLGICRKCGLFKPPSQSRNKVRVEILDRTEGRMERTRTVLVPGGRRAVVREEQNEWRIEPHAEGSLVTRTGILVAPLLSYWLAAWLKLRNPTRDSLIALKSSLEGTRGTGSFAAAREMLEASLAARRHCSCG